MMRSRYATAAGGDEARCAWWQTYRSNASSSRAADKGMGVARDARDAVNGAAALLGCYNEGIVVIRTHSGR
jgi:hypothetical protein